MRRRFEILKKSESELVFYMSCKTMTPEINKLNLPYTFTGSPIIENNMLSVNSSGENKQYMLIRTGSLISPFLITMNVHAYKMTSASQAFFFGIQDGADPSYYMQFSTLRRNTSDIGFISRYKTSSMTEDSNITEYYDPKYKNDTIRMGICMDGYRKAISVFEKTVNGEYRLRSGEDYSKIMYDSVGYVKIGLSQLKKIMHYYSVDNIMIFQGKSVRYSGGDMYLYPGIYDKGDI